MENQDEFPIPSAETRQLFQRTLEWLDAGAPESVGFEFDMRVWFEVDDCCLDCGTACCIGGAIEQFEKNRFGESTKNNRHD